MIDFDGVLSRDARKVRDHVLEICINYGTSKIQVEVSSFISKIKQQYDPLAWEKSVLYATPQDIITTIDRKTSAAYQQVDVNGPILKKTRGNKTGPRNHNIDWLALARFDKEWWIEAVPRPGSIHPDSLDKLPEFMDMYKLFSSWFIVEFSYHTLFGVLDFSRRFSLEIVKECMEEVDDPRKRSIEYLGAIIDKELMAREIEMMENKELTENSKRILKAISELARNRDKPVDWDTIDKKASIDLLNVEEFEKVKLS
jgi:hypothetical protein